VKKVIATSLITAGLVALPASQPASAHAQDRPSKYCATTSGHQPDWDVYANHGTPCYRAWPIWRKINHRNIPFTSGTYRITVRGVRLKCRSDVKYSVTVDCQGRHGRTGATFVYNR
jgi:hypothetical protein